MLLCIRGSPSRRLWNNKKLRDVSLKDLRIADTGSRSHVRVNNQHSESDNRRNHYFNWCANYYYQFVLLKKAMLHAVGVDDGRPHLHDGNTLDTQTIFRPHAISSISHSRLYILPRALWAVTCIIVTIMHSLLCSIYWKPAAGEIFLRKRIYISGQQENTFLHPWFKPALDQQTKVHETNLRMSSYPFLARNTIFTEYAFYNFYHIC